MRMQCLQCPAAATQAAVPSLAEQGTFHERWNICSNGWVQQAADKASKPAVLPILLARNSSASHGHQHRSMRSTHVTYLITLADQSS